MRNFWLLPSPNNKLCRISEVTARNIWRRIGLSPCHYIQNFISKFLKAVCYGKNIMVCTRYPYSAVVFEFITTKFQPVVIELVHLLV